MGRGIVRIWWVGRVHGAGAVGGKEAEAGRRLRGWLSASRVLTLLPVLAASGFRPAATGAPLYGASPEWPWGPTSS